MLTVAGLSPGLAALPAWLDAGPPLEALLAEWVQASGYRTAGLVWPACETPELVRFVSGRQVTGVGAVPPEVPQVLATLTDGPPTTVWAVPQSSGRLYTLLAPPGQAAGLLFAERAPGPWGETDRQYLALSAKLVARSPALAPHLASVVGAARLAERLADAALIAGRLSHDYAGVLTGVSGYAELARQALPADSPAGAFVAKAVGAAARGMELNRRVREFATCGEPNPTPGNVRAAVLAEGARLGLNACSWDIPAELPDVALGAGPLKLVLGHLLANAAEALPAAGPVEVRARVIDLTPAGARTFFGTARPGAALEIVVTDRGPGLKPGAASRPFAEPFVTTKPRHPGLGLATAYRALAANGGGVRLDPARPGTAARAVLPLARVAPRPPQIEPRPQPLSVQG